MFLRSDFSPIKKLILKTPDLESFLLGDCSALKYQYNNWVNLLPRVHPFYAIKCNPYPEIVNYLSSLPKMGLSCVSSEELSLALNTSIKKENIIFSNPCKSVSHLKFAKTQNISLTSFDNEQELLKIKNIHPEAKSIIRIKVAEEYSTLHSLKDKFGASLNYAKKLIRFAKRNSLNIVGVSFHVESNSKNPESYYYAIKDCKEIINYAKKELDINMNFLDIGGGFSGSDKQVKDGKLLFIKQAEMINQGLHEFFPEKEYSEDNFRIIAEPGRYFAEKSLMLATSISNKKLLKQGELITQDENVEPDKIMYHINQGAYSGFMNVFTKTNSLKPLAVFSNGELDVLSCISRKMINSLIWGPTCDSYDYVDKGTQLPHLEVGDWLIYDDFGAYTTSKISEFNGLKPPKIFWINKN